jgi:hypothetical protein
MAISVDWGTKVITVPKADTTLVTLGPPEIRQLDVDTFRLALKALEDDEVGMAFPDTHQHNTEVTIAGIVYARFIEFINGYTITFEPGAYGVDLVGANNNIMDVLNMNATQVRSNNSAGLVVAISGETFQAMTQDVLGLSGENTVWSAMVHDANSNLTSARITQYTDNSLTTIRKQWDVTASFNADRELQSYQLVEV